MNWCVAEQKHSFETINLKIQTQDVRNQVNIRQSFVNSDYLLWFFKIVHYGVTHILMAESFSGMKTKVLLHFCVFERVSMILFKFR